MRAETEQRANRAYMIRQRTGCSWAVIAEHFGMSAGALHQSCQRWSVINKKKWPPGPYLSFGRICYELASVDGMTWNEVAEELSRARHDVVKAAREHCKTKKIHWPYWGRFNQTGQNNY